MKRSNHDNGDCTVTDRATGLVWSQSDSGVGMDWASALAWVAAKNSSNYLGHSDWRLPNAKELQSIVDYGRSPDTTGSAAIDPVFGVTSITNENGKLDYPFYWTSTTHGGKVSLQDPREAGVFLYKRHMIPFFPGLKTGVATPGGQLGFPDSDSSDRKNGPHPRQLLCQTLGSCAGCRTASPAARDPIIPAYRFAVQSIK